MSQPTAETPHKLWRVYEEAVAALRGKDIAVRCAAAGYRYDPERIDMTFLGRRFEFSVPRFALDPPKEDAGAAEQRSVAGADERLIAERILILHYLARASGAPLSGRLVGFDQLPGGRFYGSAFRARTEMPLARIFASAPGRLAEVAASLGGARVEHGDAAAAIWPFPRIPMTLIVWAGDEELPPNAKVLFDDTAEGYHSTEDLAVLGDLVIRRVKEMMG
jgi:hypothetical protein